MHWWILLVTAFSLSLHAGERETLPPSSLAGTAGLVSTLANGSVCVITGEYVDSQTDLAIPGPVSLTLSRNYSSQDRSSSYLGRSWHWSRPLVLGTYKANVGENKIEARQFRSYLRESSGAVLHYEGVRKKHTESKEILLTLIAGKGLSNCGGREISARTNLKNQECRFYRNIDAVNSFFPVRPEGFSYAEMPVAAPLRHLFASRVFQPSVNVANTMLQEMKWSNAASETNGIAKIFQAIEGLGLRGTTSSAPFVKQYFLNKTYKEMEEILYEKFGAPHRGAAGGKSFFNPRTKRSFHLHQHPEHQEGKPHVDIKWRRNKKAETFYYLKEE